MLVHKKDKKEIKIQHTQKTGVILLIQRVSVLNKIKAKKFFLAGSSQMLSSKHTTILIKCIVYFSFQSNIMILVFPPVLIFSFCVIKFARNNPMF